MPTLNLNSQVLAYSDAAAGNSPALRDIDRRRTISGLVVDNPKTDSRTLPAGTDMFLFNGIYALNLDNTTDLELILAPGATDRYRLNHIGGTSPDFRNRVVLDLSGIALTFAVQANGTMKVTAASGNPFLTLDPCEAYLTGPFSLLNQGHWRVLGNSDSGNSIYMSRDGDFQGISEVVTPTTSTQFQMYSIAGPQVGDTLEVLAGVASLNLKPFEITAVTPFWVEFRSTTPLALQANVSPGTNNVRIYTEAKRFIRVEADQDCILTINGDIDITVRPWVPGDPQGVGEFTLTGLVYSLAIVNKSTQSLHITVLSAE